MDVGELKNIAFEVVKAAFADALKNGGTVEEGMKELVELVGSTGLKCPIPDEKLRQFVPALVAQIRKDEQAMMDRREGI